MSQMTVAVFVFFAMLFILSVCAALITINGNSCYFIANFYGQVEVVSCSYIAGICYFVCCAEWHVRVLCRLI